MGENGRQKFLFVALGITVLIAVLSKWMESNEAKKMPAFKETPAQKDDK